MVETLVNIKMGYEELAQADQLIICSWVVMMAIASIVGLYVCVIAGRSVDYDKEEKSEEIIYEDDQSIKKDD